MKLQLITDLYCVNLYCVFQSLIGSKWNCNVEGHSAKDYLEDERVRNAIRESFGYYEGGLDELTRRSRKRAASKRRDAYEIQKESSIKDIISGDQNSDSDVKLDFLGGCSGGNKRCGDICLPPEKKCRLNYSSNPKEYNKRRLLSKLGRGTLSSTLGGLGQDLERAYLRTRDLVDGIKNKDKPATKRQKIKKAILSEARLAGVQLGQGTISKKLKEVDKALIDLQEEADIVSNQLKEKIGIERDKIRNFVQSRVKK